MIESSFVGNFQALQSKMRIKDVVVSYLRFLPYHILLAFVARIISGIARGRGEMKRAVGFFHPYTNDGGGGERVLWCAVKAIQEEFPDIDCVIYTGDGDASSESLEARAIDRFGVRLFSAPKVPSPCNASHLL